METRCVHQVNWRLAGFICRSLWCLDCVETWWVCGVPSLFIFIFFKKLSHTNNELMFKILLMESEIFSVTVRVVPLSVLCTTSFRPLSSLLCCCSFALNGAELILMFSALCRLSLTSKQTPMKDSWDWLSCLATTKGVGSPLLFQHKWCLVTLCIGNLTQCLIVLCVAC